MARPSGTSAAEDSSPGRDCPRCPRLVDFRQHWRELEPEWFNAPVDSFGPLDARLLVLGLAPGLRGANRTGRPFTGDYAGDLLYSTLNKITTCRDFLNSTIKEMSKLVVVIALGRIAHETFVSAGGARRSQFPF